MTPVAHPLGIKAALIALFAPIAVLAAPPAQTVPQPMQVVIARSADAGCEPQCLEWISAQGMIDASTPRQFKKVLAALGKRKLPILIDSAGGSVNEALEVGRMIRAKGLDVVVTKTLFKPCEKLDTACKQLKAREVHPALPQARLSRCASSCVFVLAAGSRRYVGAPALVGLHQIASFSVHSKVLRTYRILTRYQYGVPVQQQKSLVSEKKIAETKQAKPTPDTVYEKIAAYFVEMGIGEGVMPILMSTPNASIRWLRSNELTSTRLATDFLSGEQLLLAPKSTASMPIAAPPFAPSQATPTPSFKGMPTCNPAAGIVTACVPSIENLPVAPATAPLALPKSPDTATQAVAAPLAPPAAAGAPSSSAPPQPAADAETEGAAAAPPIPAAAPTQVALPVPAAAVPAPAKPPQTAAKRPAEPKARSRPKEEQDNPFARASH